MRTISKKQCTEVPLLLALFKASKFGLHFDAATDMWHVENKELEKRIDEILKEHVPIPPKPKEYVVDVYRNKLIVKVKYDPVLIEKFRENLGVWSKTQKAWLFPVVAGPRLSELRLGEWSETADRYRQFDSEVHAMSSALDADFELRGLLREPKNYQVAGIKYLLKTQRAFLADSLGLGKSFQAIAAVEQVENYPCLIVCEASMKTQWKYEVEMSVNRTVSVLYGRQPYKIPDTDFVVINQDILHDWAAVLSKHKFKGLIVDESSNFANTSKRSTAIKKVAKTVTGVRFNLSGTAVMNGDQTELANQLAILDRHKEFGGKTGLRKMDISELNTMLRSCCYLRRTTADVYADRTEDVRMKFNNLIVEVDCPEYGRAESDILNYIGELAAMFARQTNDDPRSARVRAMVKAAGAESLVKLMKLRQIIGEAKINPAVEYVEKFLASTDNEKIILFAFHERVIRELKDRLNCDYIAGGVSDIDRAEAIRRFQNDSDARVIVLNTRSAGKGITLSAASHVLFVESEWSQALMRQCLGRAHMRADNPHPALGLVMVVPGTVDSDMLSLRERKASVSDTIVDGSFDDYEFDEGGSMNDMFDFMIDKSLSGVLGSDL